MMATTIKNQEVNYVGKPLVREYRCDSHTHERNMRVTLTPYPDGRIELHHITLREIPFPHHFHPETVKTVNVSRGESIARRCNICNRLQLPGALEWIEPGQLVMETARTLKVIHTVCEDCKNKEWRIARSAPKVD